MPGSTQLIFPLLLMMAASLEPTCAAAQELPSAEHIEAIVRSVAHIQEDALLHKRASLRYQVHRVDRKEDTTRDLVESKDGNVARLILHRDKPLTEQENAGEVSRLTALLGTTHLRDRQKDEDRSRTFGVDMIHAMPDAMLFTPTPGQPQLPNLSRTQLVLDFAPNPQFHPRTTAETALTCIAGRLWVDTGDRQLVRIETHVTQNINLAWGLLARVYAGGTVDMEQRKIADNLYAYSHIGMHLKLRELMVKVAPYDSDLDASAYQVLSAAPTGDEAIHALLADKVPTQ